IYFATRRQARDPHSQSVLRRLFGRRRGRGLRTRVPADHARNRLPARPRHDRRRVAQAHRRVLHRLAVAPAGPGRRCSLSLAAPQVPVPAQEVAIAAYGDEAHVDKNRELYVAKFDLADQIIGGRYGYRRPAGGFFLWLDVSAQGGDEAAAIKLWRDGGLRVIPGHYLARDGADGRNPGQGYIRV